MTKQTAIGYRLSARTLKSTIDYRLSTIGSKIFFAILCWVMFACSDGGQFNSDPSTDAGPDATSSTGGQGSAPSTSTGGQGSVASTLISSTGGQGLSTGGQTSCPASTISCTNPSDSSVFSRGYVSIQCGDNSYDCTTGSDYNCVMSVSSTEYQCGNGECSYSLSCQGVNNILNRDKKCISTNFSESMNCNCNASTGVVACVGLASTSSGTGGGSSLSSTGGSAAILNSTGGQKSMNDSTGGESSTGGQSTAGDSSTVSTGGTSNTEPSPCDYYSDCVGNNKSVIAIADGSTTSIANSNTCYTTSSLNVESVLCSNFSSPNTMLVNGTTLFCDGTTKTSVGNKTNGGYCFHGFDTISPTSSFTISG